jgi:hypothetical protein
MATWVRLFTQLILAEQDKHVREMTYQVMQIYVSPMRDEIAEFAAELIVPMWNSLFDGAKEVMSIAENAMATLFPVRVEFIMENY